MYKDGTARVEVEQGAQIIADGNVTISATADSFAYAQATSSGASSNNQSQSSLQLSVSAAYAQSNTYAQIDSDATISAGGSVTIETSGITNPKPSAGIGQNLTAIPTQGPPAQRNGPPPPAPADPPTNVKQFGIAVGISNETSLATVAQGATITAGGDITVSSGGAGGNQNSNGSQVQTQSYRDGSAGVAIDINLNFTNVQAEVDGSLSADISQVNNAGATALAFNPFTQADLADSIIDFGQADGYQTGDQITYQSGPGGPIGGLTSGQSYYVIVVGPESIRLASTPANAQAGNYIVFTPYPTLEVPTSAALPGGASLTFAPGPALSASDADTTLTFTAGPTMSGSPALAFTPAQATSPATIERSTGNWLSNGFMPGDEISVSGTLANNGIYTIGSISLDGTTLTLTADPGFVQGQPVVFENSSDAGDLGLTLGHTYDVEVDDSEPDVIQFTDPTAADPTAIVPLSQAATGTVSVTLRPVQEIGLSATPGGRPVELYLSPQFTGSTQTVSASLASNELALNFVTGFEEGDAFVFEGATNGSGTGATDNLGLTVGNLYYPVADPNNANAFYIAGSLENAVDAYNDIANDESPSGVVTLTGSASSLTFNFDPLASTDGTNNTIDMGFDVGLNTSFTNGTALVYQGALGTTLTGLTEGQTCYAILDPGDRRQIRLAATKADAAEAYESGLSTYDTDPSAATDGLGETLFNAGASTAATAGAASGPYTVTVSNNEIVFEFDPGLNYGDEVDYAGALPGQPAIDTTGGSPLLAGTYFAVPDTNNPDAIGLATTYAGNTIPLSLASGSSTQIQISIGMPQGPFPVTVSNNQLVLPFPDGFTLGQQITYLGPASGSPGIANLDTYANYYVVPDPANPDAFGLATTAGNAVSDTLVTISGGQTTVNLGPSLPATTQAIVSNSNNTLTLAGMPVYFTAASAGTQSLVVASSANTALDGTSLSFDAGNDVSTTANTITFASPDGLSTGDLVTYENSTQYPDIGGLTGGLDDYVLVVNPTTIQLIPASPIAFTTASSGTQDLYVVSSSNSVLTAGTALSFDAASDVDTTANTITYTLPSSPTSGLHTGDEVVYVNTTGNADIGGLTSGQTYTVLAQSGNTIQLTQTFATDPGWDTGDEVVYLGNGNGASDVTGLNVGQNYYVVEQSPGVLQLSASPLTTVALTSASSGTQSLVVVSSANSALQEGTSFSFDSSAGVTTATNTIAFATPDGLRTGDKVEYENNGNSSIGGLESGQDYYVVTVDPSTIELTTSQTTVVSLLTASSVSTSGATPQVILAAPLGSGAGPFADTRGGAVVAFSLSSAVMSGVASSISASGNPNGQLYPSRLRYRATSVRPRPRVLATNRSPPS